VKTASVPAQNKPVIVKTEKGRVMMQAIPKDAKTAAAKTDASAPPRALASAAPAVPPTPDLRAAAD
jgi:hypothetical protein